MKSFQVGLRSSVFASMMSLTLAAVGCSTTGTHARWYDGEQKAATDVALVKVQRNLLQTSARVKTIDGESFSKGKINNTELIELRPGTHTLGVEYFDSNGRTSTKDMMLTFDCTSNHVYELHVAPIDEGAAASFLSVLPTGRGHWTAWVIDTETAEVIAGQKRDTPLKWYEN